MGSFASLVSLICMMAVSGLHVGDKAPSLEGTMWLKGEGPVFQRQLTVVEFWTTWCSACQAEIPHMTRLQMCYGDQVAVVGLSGEPSSDIVRFLEKHGEEIAFRVGHVPSDLKEQYTERANGIPYAFLINKEGTVIWRGHPEDLDDILDKALAGSLDIERIKRISELEDALRETLKSNNSVIIGQAAGALLALDPANEKALRVRTVVSKRQKETTVYRAVYDRLDVESLSGDRADRLAWDLITEKELPYRYVGAALRLSTHAVKKEPENGRYANTYARVQYCLGNIEEAIAWEEKAVKLDPGEGDYEADLHYYMAVKALRDGAPRSGNRESP